MPKVQGMVILVPESPEEEDQAAPDDDGGYGGRSAVTPELPCYSLINQPTCPDDSSYYYLIRSVTAKERENVGAEPHPHLCQQLEPPRSHTAPGFCNNRCSPHVVVASILSSRIFPQFPNMFSLKKSSVT